MISLVSRKNSINKEIKSKSSSSSSSITPISTIEETPIIFNTEVIFYRKLIERRIQKKKSNTSSFFYNVEKRKLDTNLNSSSSSSNILIHNKKKSSRNKSYDYDSESDDTIKSIDDIDLEPHKIIPNKNIYYCEVCKHDMGNNTRMYDYHCSGNKHMKRVIRANPEIVEKLPPFRLQRSYFCKACNYISNIRYNFIDHCSSKKHLEYPKKLRGKEDDIGLYYCGLVCNFTSTIRSEVEVHMQSADHISNVPVGSVLQTLRIYNPKGSEIEKNLSIVVEESEEEGVIEFSEKDKLTCTLCDKISLNSSNFDTHCNGLIHKKNVSSATKSQIDNLPPYLTKKSYYCEFCNFATLNPNAFEVHLRTFQHKANTGDKNTTEIISYFYCDKKKCNFKTNERSEYNEHIKSVAHKANIPMGEFEQRQRKVRVNNNILLLKEAGMDIVEWSNNSKKRQLNLSNDDVQFSIERKRNKLTEPIKNYHDHEMQCKICNFECESCSYYDRHCMTEKHKENVMKSSKTAIEKLAPSLPKKTYYCEICKYENIYHRNFLMHCLLDSHEKLMAKANKKLDITSKYRCNLSCLFETDDLLALREHNESQIHIDNIPKGQYLQKNRYINRNLKYINKSDDNLRY